jgi:hypothetical protein
MDRATRAGPEAKKFGGIFDRLKIDKLEKIDRRQGSLAQMKIQAMPDQSTKMARRRCQLVMPRSGHRSRK